MYPELNNKRSLAIYLYNYINKYSLLDAIKIGDRLISYQELNYSALKVANILSENGFFRKTIGIVGQRKPSSYFGILGILYSGCSYTPLNIKYSKDRLIKIMKTSNINCLIGDKEDLILFLEIIGGDYPISTIIIPEGKSPENKNWIDTNSISNLTRPVECYDEDIAYLLFTSGSTGIPKGVQVMNSNVVEFIEGMKQIYKLETGFHASQSFDLSFDPSVSDMFFTWSCGGLLCVLPEEEKMTPSEYIIREKINFWNSVPSLAAFMLKIGTLTPGIFPSIEYSMFCGEQFPKYIADAWQKAAPNSTIENLYGPTEATIYISRYKYDGNLKNEKFKNSIIPIGLPFPNQKVEIINENDLPVKIGEIGEICFKGSQITKGYLNDEKKTKEVFVNFEWDFEKPSEIWYKTGDLGFKNINNEIECIGRKDSQIKIAGRRIEIGEIESVLSKFSQIADIRIVALRDDSDIVIGCLGFTLNYISKEDEFKIRKQCEKFLEKIFFPKKIIKIDQFPLTLSGKVDIKQLEKMGRLLINKTF